MPLVPGYIKNLAPYRGGKPAEELARESGLERIVKLASNENPLGPSPKALAAARCSLEEAHRYPDQAAFELRTALARRFDVRLENVITGAGSEGIMSTIMRTFLCDDDELISARGSFIGFRVLADASGRRRHWVSMQDYRYHLPGLADAINEHTKIIYLANPDNPTGTYFTVAEFDAFMARVPDRVLVLLDEAYFEYGLPGLPRFHALSLRQRHHPAHLFQSPRPGGTAGGLRLCPRRADRQPVEGESPLRAVAPSPGGGPGGPARQ